MKASVRAKMLFLSVFLVTLCSCSVKSSAVVNGLRGEPADKSTFRLDYQFYPKAEGWLKLHRIPMSWVDARLACSLEGAHLASPITDEVASVLRVLAQEAQLPAIFTGIQAKASVEDYYSIEGIHLSRIPVVWQESQPNNKDNKQRCLDMLPHGPMRDVECDLMRPFFCYKKKEGYITTNKCGYHDHEYQVDPQSGHCYKIHVKPTNWRQALSVCTAEGGTLAIINSEAEAKFIEKMALQHNIKSWVFLGIQSWFHELGQWRTLDGKSLKEAGFERWLKGEPNNLGGQEYCGSFIVGHNNNPLVLNDSNCSFNYAFVCEIPPSTPKSSK